MQREFLPTVYILASQRNGTLYIGVTSNFCSAFINTERA
jgi:putative endonuclease